MREANKFVAHASGDIARYAGLIGPRGIYQLTVVGAVLFAFVAVGDLVFESFRKALFVVFRVLYSWVGGPDSYQALTYEVGAVVGLALFLMPFVAFAVWSRLRRKDGASCRTRIICAAAACCISGWSAQVVPQTILALKHPGATLNDKARCDKAIASMKVGGSLQGTRPAACPEYLHAR